jgi:hypothetical protein
MSDETAQQIFSVFYRPRNSHASFTTVSVPGGWRETGSETENS